MNKSSYFIFFLLSITLNVIAQKGEATLFFRDGTKIEGLARITKFSEIKFQKSKESKKITYNYKNIDKITIWEKKRKEYVEYVYKVPIGVKPMLLEIILKGNISIFRKTQLNFDRTFGTVLYMTNNDNKILAYRLGYISVSPYKRLFSEHMPDYNTRNKSIKRKLFKRIKGCKEILNKIENKDFHKKGILDIVNYYNDNCHV